MSILSDDIFLGRVDREANLFYFALFRLSETFPASVYNFK